MQKKKVVIACKRRSVSQFIQDQLEEMLGDYADISMVLVNEEPNLKIHCDLVIAISEEIARKTIPMLLGNTEVIMLRLAIQKSMYGRLKELEGEKKALVVNNTRELSLETIAMLSALGVKNIELIPFYPGCTEIYPDVTAVITPNEFGDIPSYIKKIIDIGDRRLDPLMLVEVFSRLDCLDAAAIEMIFNYGQEVISVNRGITELTRNGHDFGFNQQQFVEGFSDAVLLLDQDCKVCLFNSAAQRLFAIPYSELMHREIRELVAEAEELFRQEQGAKNVPLQINGKKYLATWRVFGGRARGNSTLVLKSFEELRTLCARYSGERSGRGEVKYSFDDILGSSTAMRELKKKAARFAETEFPVLIQGESGTGKELLAQAIHRASRRKDGPFIAFNCAALTDSLLESELFGYNEGAFTGAAKKGRAGIFEMANGGTLFMDEIGDVSLNLQAKILRVLQEKEVVRVGGSQVIPVDVRIISATNQDLQSVVKEKKFRLDLYYRLNTLILHTIPLRERPEDIWDMLPAFLTKNRMKKNIDEEAVQFMLRYPWPGNVREFQNCMSYLSIVEHSTIRTTDFPEYMRTEPGQTAAVRTEEVSVEQSILTELNRCRLSGEKTGRKKLAEAVCAGGIPITEAEIRVYLEQLQAEGLIEISRGRGGTQITKKGLQKLKKY